MGFILYVTCLIIVVLTSLHAIFSEKFDDNLVQRLGLSVFCFGSTMRLLEVTDVFPTVENARYLQTYGAALFCLGTYYKFWRKK